MLVRDNAPAWKDVVAVACDCLRDTGDCDICLLRLSPNPFMKYRVRVLSVGIGVLLNVSGLGANFTWDGGAGSGSEWSRDNNWVGNNAPPSNGTADLFFAGATRLDANADLATWTIRSLTFNNGAGSFNIQGGTLVLGSGGITNNDNSEQDVSNNLVLSAPQSFDTTSTGGLDINGSINNGGNLLTLSSAGSTASVRLFGVISGSGGITKTGAGAAIMSGVAANTYTGTTTVTQGALQLGFSSSDAGVTRINGPVLINGGALNVSQNEQIADSVTVTITSGSLGVASGVSETIGALDMTTGTVAIAGGSLTVGNLSLNASDIQGGINSTFTLNGNATVSASSNTASIVAETLSLGNGMRTFSVSDGAATIDLQISSAIKNGDFMKTGVGTLRLNGSVSNTHGSTVVSAGTLELNNTAGTIAVPGSLSIGPAIVRLLKSDQISDTSVVAISNGLLDLNGNSETVSGLTLTGATVATGAGVLTVSNIAVNASPASSLLSGKLSLGGAVRDFTVADDSSNAADLTVSGVVSSGGINKLGAGTLLLSGANTLAGQITLNAGEIALGNNVALGSGGLIFSGGGIRADSAPRTIANSITFNSDGVVNGAFDLTFSGDAQLTANTTVIANSSGVTTFSGAITQSGGSRSFTKAGTGTVKFGGTSANTYTGTTTVTRGTLQLNKSAGTNAVPGALVIGDGTTGTAVVVRLQANEQIANNSVVTINGNASLLLDGFAETIGSLNLINGSVGGGGDLILGGDIASSGTGLSEISVDLDLGGATRILNVGDGAGPIDLSVNGKVTNGGIIKNGAGTLRFFATPTFAGGLTLNAGELAVFGTIGTGTLTINAGAIRSDGAGRSASNPVSIGGNFTVGGTLALTLSGPITLTGDRTITIANTGLTTFSGAVGQDAGSRSLTKVGAGTLQLSGSTNNTYAGTTIVNEGVLVLAKSGGALAISGTALVIGDTSGGADADVVRLATNSGILPATSVTITSSGLLDLNGQNQTLSALTLVGGKIKTGAGTLTADGTLSAQASASGASIEGNLSLGGGTRLLNVGNGTATDDLTVNATVVDGSLTKVGSGTLVLSGTAVNTYAGATTVDAGTLELNKTAGQNAVAGQLNINPGAVVRLRANDQIIDTSSVTTGSFSTFNLNNFSETIGDLTMNGGSVSTGTGTLTITGNILASVSGGSVPSITGNLNFGGAPRTVDVSDDSPTPEDFQIAATLSNGSLTKTGAGTLKLSGNSPAFAGSTAVTAGKLLVSGNLSGSAVTVNSGSILGGNGTTGNTLVSDGATLSPGESVGTLTTGNLTLSDGSISLFELNTSGVVGGPNDLVAVNGALTLDGTLAVSELSGLELGVYRLFNYVGAFVDHGLNLQPAFLATHPGSFVDTGTTGQVNLVVVPEPSAALIVAASIGFSQFRRRRRI